MSDASIQGEVEESETDVEMALLAVLSGRDTGEATEPIRLDTLSETEKRVVLRLMRDRLEISGHALRPGELMAEAAAAAHD